MHWLLIKAIHLIFRGLGFLLPYLIWLVSLVTRLMLTAVISLIVGIPESIHRIANDETERAIKGGLPTRYDHHFYSAIRIVAAAMVIVGWLIFALSMVFIMTLM